MKKIQKCPVADATGQSLSELNLFARMGRPAALAGIRTEVNYRGETLPATFTGSRGMLGFQVAFDRLAANGYPVCWLASIESYPYLGKVEDLCDAELTSKNEGDDSVRCCLPKGHPSVGRFNHHFAQFSWGCDNRDEAQPEADLLRVLRDKP